MSYPRIRYRRQGVSRDESLVSYEQDLRFKVSASREESYLGFDEETNLDHDESLVQSFQNLRFNIPEVDDESYLDPDEETGFSDGGQDDPRCYGICPGRFDPDAISNKDYRRGNDNFDYIKAWWPQTIPRHHTWIGKYPVDERFALAGLKDKIGMSLREMLKLGYWIPYTFPYRLRMLPYIATITYSDPLVTLSYALFREHSGKVSVVAVKLDPALPRKITIVSRWYVVEAAEGQGGHTNTEGILDFQRPPRPCIGDEYMKWSPLLCEWWVPYSNSSLLEKLRFP
ncbi:hypothetical protein E5D57_009438 [Metarhizium anisopliae]|nr:hypothetical protein E5D57_009438 [Metarhizium anisopliae]